MSASPIKVQDQQKRLKIVIIAMYARMVGSLYAVTIVQGLSIWRSACKGTATRTNFLWKCLHQSQRDQMRRRKIGFAQNANQSWKKDLKTRKRKEKRL
jgi:hypothetical protein